MSLSDLLLDPEIDQDASAALTVPIGPAPDGQGFFRDSLLRSAPPVPTVDYTATVLADILPQVARWLGQKRPSPEAAKRACLRQVQAADDNGMLAELAQLVQAAWFSAWAPTPDGLVQWPEAATIDTATMANLLVTVIKKLDVERRKRARDGLPAFTAEQNAVLLRRYAVLTQLAESFGMLPEVQAATAKRWARELAHERQVARLKEQARLAVAQVRVSAVLAVRVALLSRSRQRRSQRRAIVRAARPSGRKRRRGRSSGDDDGGGGDVADRQLALASSGAAP